MTAASFFRNQPNEQLSQGDFVLAPTAVVLGDEITTPDYHVQPRPELGQSVEVPAWDDYHAEAAEQITPVLRVRWNPAVVVSHDCQLDKDFNRRVARLTQEGVDEADAIRQASSDPTLDPLVLVAPVIGYEEVDPALHAGIKAGQTVGYFPIPPAPIFDAEELLVDLGQITTVHRAVAQRFEKLASLSHEAAGVLRYKLGEALAYRSLAVLPDIEAMVGEIITSVEAVEKSAKRTVLVLHLAGGKEVPLEIRTPRTGMARAVERILFRG